jgi:hypothetical protein
MNVVIDTCKTVIPWMEKNLPRLIEDNTSAMTGFHLCSLVLEKLVSQKTLLKNWSEGWVPPQKG